MKRLALLLCSLLCLGAIAAPVVASADVNDFTITRFTSDETLSNADKQGQLQIVEHIAVDFTDQNHGILRAIPNSYKGHSLDLHVNSVTSESGAAAGYTTYQSNGNTVLKIGDANLTVTGSQEYTIDYTLHNVITFYKDHDELYWNVNGDQWQQPFTTVELILHMPANLKQNHQAVCYTGSFNSKDQNCIIDTRGNKLAATTTQPLGASQTLTYVAGFNKGYFQPYPWYQTLISKFGPLLEALLPIIILGGGSFVYWLKRGRDPRGTGIIVPQYDAPDNLRPLEVGTIIDFKADNRDITATIIDLAIRGYIKIIETKHDHALRKDTLSYSFELLNPDASKLNPNEAIILQSLFASGEAVGSQVDVSALKNSLYQTAKTVGQNVEASLTTDGYFKANPLSAGKLVSVIFSLLLFVLIFGAQFLNTPLIIGLLGAIIITGIFASRMAARTAKGVAAKEHILGLKMYLQVAEKDRLKMLQGPNAKYAANAAEPTKTVDLFEKLLPYAMVLGVEQQWAGQFQSLYTQPPTWYTGNWTTFNVLYLTSNLNSGLMSATNTAFSAPRSSSSSGFGGGGFSGGGGGGGGGGW